MDELSKEELQQKILELTELNTKLTEQNSLKDGEIQSLKDRETEHLKTIKETRDLNNKLVLGVSSQIFTPKKVEEKEEDKQDEIIPLSELAKQL